MSRNESVRRDRTKEKQLTARDYSKYNFRSETSAYKEIFEKVTELLNKYNEDASFMYKTHLDVS